MVHKCTTSLQGVKFVTCVVRHAGNFLFNVLLLFCRVFNTITGGPKFSVYENNDVQRRAYLQN